MLERVIEINDVVAELYLKNAQYLMSLGVPEKIALPYIVMVKGYGDDWDEFTELNFDDLENGNVVDAGYEDYQLWLNDTLTNLVEKGEL